MRDRLNQAGLVAFFAAMVMLTNLGGPRLWDIDEPRNAGCAREMWLRGDWVVPTFNAELRTHKPVLLYWCMMAAYSLLGPTELAARLPSALAAIGTCVCTYLMGRRLFSPQAGVWAGIALATSLMFAVAGRAATPDADILHDAGSDHLRLWNLSSTARNDANRFAAAMEGGGRVFSAALADRRGNVRRNGPCRAGQRACGARFANGGDRHVPASRALT
jgi:hypothetical protein